MMKKASQVAMAVLLCASPALIAQEVAYLNLLGVTPRREFRAPKAPDPVCEDGVCTGGGVGSGSVGCGAPARDEPRALKTTLVSLDRFSYTAGDELEMEVRIENVGSLAMDIPWSPHLSDLQPADETLAFSYSSLYLSLLLRRPDGQTEDILVESLYGVQGRAGSLLTLRPGQWVRLRMETTLSVPVEKLAEDGRWSANVTYGLRSEKFVPNVKFGGYSTSIENQYPRYLSGNPVALQIVAPKDKSRKQSAAAEDSHR
jgi:hypothetical protein